MKKVWVTKAGANADIDAHKNIKFLHAPLLHIAPATYAPKHPRPDDYLVFTSKAGVTTFCEFSDRREFPVFTVGDATAQLARDLGFKKIESARGDVQALRKMITSQPALKAKRLYYASGQEVSGDIENDLTKDGFNIVRAILYETYGVQHIPTQIQDALSTDRDLTVLLYSPKGARIFCGLDLDFKCIDSVSISANVDKELESLGVKTRKIAKTPTETDMIKELI